MRPENDREEGGKPKRAAIYLRVSTGRQAEHDLSIPDQRTQISTWLAQRRWVKAAEFVEPGASATDDKRPEFQRMIENASEGAFDIIVVHSYSRFFRDAFGLEFYVRKLAKHGVRLVSITQELGDDPAQVMMRQVIALFDEYQSKENAKHVLRSMKENARQGYWNGSRPPFGFKAAEVERRGSRVKKKLSLEPVEAETVRLMFRLFLEGVNDSGPLGIKGMVRWLNERGYRTRGGAAWGIGPVHAMLSNPVYAGRGKFRSGRLTLARSSTASRSTTLKYGSLAVGISWSRRFWPAADQIPVFAVLFANGAPGRIRTYDLCLRRAALYPAELRVPKRARLIPHSPPGRKCSRSANGRG